MAGVEETERRTERLTGRLTGRRGLGRTVAPRRLAERYVVPLARVLLGVVWILTGWSTLTDPAGNALAVRAYRLLPGGAADQVGYLLPPLAVVVGVALVLGLLTRGAALVSSLVLTAYVVALGSAWARGLPDAGGPFGRPLAGPLQMAGTVDGTAYGADLARAVLMLLVGAVLVVLPPGRLALDGLLARGGRDRDRKGVGRDGVEAVEA